MFPGLTEEQQEVVVASIADFMEDPKTALLVTQPTAAIV
jgi:hypothetical protein